LRPYSGDMPAPLEIAERFYAALEADDTERALELCTDDVEVIYPAEGRLPYGGRWRGREGVAAFLDAHDAAEEILEFAVGQMLADADVVLALGDFRGRAKASGREWSTRFVHALAITDGRLRRWEAFFDTAAAVAAR
jgi:ketosteroid isomerase-like protein